MKICIKKEILTELMAQNFFTVSKLSKIADVTYAILLNAYNHGRPVSIKTAEKICKVFNKSIDELFVRI